MKRPLSLVIVLDLLDLPRPLTACATFCFVDTGQVIFGKNYDWNVDDGRVTTHSRQPVVWSLDLGALDFACASPVMMLDMNANGRGDVTNALLPWSLEAKIGLVRGAYTRTTFLSDLPETEIQLAGRAPLAATCTQVSENGGAP